MSGVQFGQQIDMNGFKITELAPGTNPTDVARVDANTVSVTFGSVITTNSHRVVVLPVS